MSLNLAEANDFEKIVAIMNIRSTVERYFYGLDAKDTSALASCFSDDAYFEANTGKDRRIVFRGAEEISSTLVRLMGRVRFSLHTCGSPAITITDGHATTDVFGIARMVFADDADHELAGKIAVRGLRYRDNVELRDGAWKITRRIHNGLWQYNSDSVDPFVPPAKDIG